MNYGVWASTFELPENSRAANPQASPRVVRPQSHSQLTRSEPQQVYRNEFWCAIKGNRSRRGEWIYHLPGRPYYEQTRPEQVFCTESEAQAAGYCRSKA